MGLFSRGKSKDRTDTGAVDADPADGGFDPIEQDRAVDEGNADANGDTDAGTDGAAGGRDGAAGPLDRSAVEDDSDYLNLGAIWLRGQQGMELRLEVNEQEQQITGVTAVIGESAVQLQAFAAPRTEGVWVDIRNEIAASIVDAGGTAEVLTGEFGEELLTRMPQADPTAAPSSCRLVSSASTAPAGSSVPSSRVAPPSSLPPPTRSTRSSAPRSSTAATRPCRRASCCRCACPMPRVRPGRRCRRRRAPGRPDLNPFERGPEITEVR